jgi:DNA-binding NtrC family response regulator
MPSDDPDERTTAFRYRYVPTPAVDVSFVLRVVEGADVGLSFVLDATKPSRTLIGQSVACALRLSDPEVSRRHATCDVQGSEMRITDLGSKNGTYVNGVRIVEALLGGGEQVRVGSTVLQVEDHTAAAPPLAEATSFVRVLGASREMRRLYPLCERLAAIDLPVIIEGETGCGKEVLAESLHERGPRANGPFVVFDCTAVPPNLVESELFGHEKGAFTGATSTRRGVFEQAHGGTLLIDEIGDLDLSLQPKLLRAIERGEVQEGRFRDDLFHRLAIARIELPPLRHRRGDVAVLAQAFAQRFGGAPNALTPELLAKWERYEWPGNIRELRNAVARHLALGDLAGTSVPSAGDGFGDQETPSFARSGEHGHAHSADAPFDIVEDVLGRRLPLVTARQEVVDYFESRYVARVLAEHGGNISRAAEASGIARRHFHRLKAKPRTRG